MGCSRSTQRQLRRLRRRAAYLEIAQHGCAGIARLLRGAFALAAHRARPCRTSGRQEASCRAMGLALFWPGLFARAATAPAGALVLILTVSAGWLYWHRSAPTVDHGDHSLLKSPALAEVERAQAAYEQAIDKLAAQAKPELEKPTTPVQANYREKLLLLDSAINDLRAQAGMNPSNAHVRQQLLAMYQEKQQTLEDVLEEKQ